MLGMYKSRAIYIVPGIKGEPLINRSIATWLYVILISLLVPSHSFARVDFFATGAQIGLGVMADSLYLGASFIYQDSSRDVIVSFVNTDAHFEGSLYFMVPGIPDSAYYLFTNKPANHPNDPTRVNLSDIFDIPVGSKIYFMYKVSYYRPKYTGENITGVDLYVSTETHIWQGITDRRWATAGRIKDTNGGPTDSADFTFEDDPNGDLDCDDIIFRVTGLGLNIEEHIPEIDSSIVFDAVGNGIGDSLVIFFDMPVDTTILISVDLIWPQATPVQRLDLTPLRLESPRIISIPYIPVSTQVWTYGTGRTTVTYDSLGTLTAREGDAKDGIGPLLKDTAYLMTRYIPDNDTFFVSFTEQVAVSDIMGTSFILIKNGTGREIELTLLDPAVNLVNQDDSIMFAITDLGVDAPEAGDSLKILYTGPVKDIPRRNPAHPDNTPVPIVLIEKPVYVDILKGYYFDNDAEGYIDSIYVEATTDIPGGLTDALVQEIVSNAIALPAFRGFTVANSAVTTGGFSITVTEDKAHNPITSVTVNDILTVSAYTLSIGATVNASNSPFIDRVAPIIHWEPRSALLADYQIAGRADTLGVKFSEPVQNTASDEPFYFLDMDNGSNYSVTLRSVGMPKIDSMIFEVVSVNSTMEDGDSLWIHETDRIGDAAGNYQNNTKNIKRRLSVVKVYGSVAVERGYYFDNNGDGFVDSIYVKATTDIEGGFTEAMIDEIIDKAVTLPTFRNFTVNNSGLTSGGFYLKVTEGNSNPTTFITKDDSLETSRTTLSNGGTVQAKICPIHDKVAPLIHWNERSAFAVIHQDKSVTDTLSVTFSERIKNVSATVPFRFLSIQNATSYSATLRAIDQPSSDKMVFAVQSISGIDRMRDGDSIWVYEGDRVGDICSDESGNTVTNYQINKNNTRRRLYVERRLLPFNFIPVAVSPVNVDNIENDKYTVPKHYFDILKAYDLDLTERNGTYYGMIINVVPDEKDNVYKGFKLSGELIILDPVGNRVVEKKEMGWDDNNKRLIWAWNLKNMNRRYVGSGMYLCLIEIEETTVGSNNKGLKETKKILLGVQ